MMKHIGNELQLATGAFHISSPSVSAGTNNPGSVRILDMCMAPSGFLATALKENPGAQARAFTLPPDEGGHEIQLQYSEKNVKVESVDITVDTAKVRYMALSETNARQCFQTCEPSLN